MSGMVLDVWGDTQKFDDPGKSFEKEQKDVQDKRSGKNGRRNKCCQKGDVYVPMEKCKKGYKEIRDMKKCESRQK